MPKLCSTVLSFLIIFPLPTLQKHPINQNPFQKAYPCDLHDLLPSLIHPHLSHHCQHGFSRQDQGGEGPDRVGDLLTLRDRWSSLDGGANPSSLSRLGSKLKNARRQMKCQCLKEGCTWKWLVWKFTIYKFMQWMINACKCYQMSNVFQQRVESF